MICIKLTDNERKNIDKIGWSSILTRSEREFTSQCFDALEIESAASVLDNPKLDLYRIVVDDKEVGRFVIIKSDDENKIVGLFIYSQYRNKGYFKQVLNEMIKVYTNIALATSNKYMIDYLFKDKRFISNGWNPLSFRNGVDIRFETIKE